MHGQDVLHADCKACNLLVRRDADGIRVAFVDYDKVRFFALAPRGGSALREPEAVEALAQLNTSIPIAVTRTDRMRFLRAYVAASRGALGRSSRELFAAVWARSRHRRVLWVGPEGDVHEAWRAP